MKYLFIILIAFSFIGCDGEEPTRIVYAEFTMISNPNDHYTLSGTFGTQETGYISFNYTDATLAPIPIGFTLTTAEYSWVKGYNCTVYAYALGATELVGDTEIEVKLYVDGDLKETEIIINEFSTNTTNFIIP